jgi:hypothetical protein
VSIYNIATGLGVSHVDLVMPDDEAHRAAEKVQKRRKSGKSSAMIFWPEGAVAVGSHPAPARSVGAWSN